MSPTRKKTAKKATRKTAKTRAKKKAPARASSARKAAAKKASAKKAPAKAKKAAVKAKPTKKVAKKATKSAAKPAAKKATKKATKKTAKTSKKKAAAVEPPKKAAPPRKPGPLVMARGKKISKLGVRWTCWSCGAVFYDLNKPDPVCPKCEQDQNTKPEADKPARPAGRRDSMRALRVLDDEDAATTTRAENTNEGMELNLELGTNEKLLDQAEDAAETDED